MLSRYPSDLGIWADIISTRLLKRGVDFESLDSKGTRPIHYAARNSQKDLLDFFLSNGVDNVVDEEGYTFVNLLKSGSKPNERVLSLHANLRCCSRLTGQILIWTWKEILRFVGSLDKAEIIKEEPPQVDPSLNMKHASILIEDGVIYDIYMVKTDVKYGQTGINNF